MPEPQSKPAYSYAVVRVVPRVDRDEFMNAGVLLYSPERNFLGARIDLNGDRLRALWPEVDVSLIDRHLLAFRTIAEGGPQGGPIAALSKRERFHWLTAPRSAMIQVSPTRTGISEDPEGALDRLTADMVKLPGQSG